MVTFGSGVSAASTARRAGHEAARAASSTLGATTAKLAVVFASIAYPDVDEAAAGVTEVIGPVPIIGGTAGAQVFGGDVSFAKGVSVVLLGGDSLEVEVRTARLGAPSLLETVPAATAVAKAAESALKRGFAHYACLAFAPGILVDGEALVAAIRKGAGARAVLAGGLTGDDLVMDRPRVYVDGVLRSDRVVVTGLFSKKPIGVAARHGYRAVGPVREVTRADGIWLRELDGRRAIDVWLEDARAAGATPPSDPKELVLYLANHYEIGIVEGPPTPRGGAVPDDPRELVARAPFAIREDGALQLSASIAEGTHVRVLHASRDDLLRASGEAADAAMSRAGNEVVGALVLACSGRLAALGDDFEKEPSAIRARVSAPIGGACVYGEIARNVRDADAFFNTTAVVVAFSS
jgi:hypothetical protein